MDLKKKFSIEEIKMANKYLKKCSLFLAIGELKGIILRFHLVHSPFPTHPTVCVCVSVYL